MCDCVVEDRDSQCLGRGNNVPEVSWRRSHTVQIRTCRNLVRRDSRDTHSVDLISSTQRPQLEWTFCVLLFYWKFATENPLKSEFWPYLTTFSFLCCVSYTMSSVLRPVVETCCCVRSPVVRMFNVDHERRIFVFHNTDTVCLPLPLDRYPLY